MHFTAVRQPFKLYKLRFNVADVDIFFHKTLFMPERYDITSRLLTINLLLQFELKKTVKARVSAHFFRKCLSSSNRVK